MIKIKYMTPSEIIKRHDDRRVWTHGGFLRCGNGSTVTFTHYPLADPIRGFHKPLGFYPENAEDSRTAND